MPINENFFNRNLSKNLSGSFGYVCFFKHYIVGANEERDDHLASRFGKSIDAVHRIAGLCQIIEFAWNIVKIFIER